MSSIRNKILKEMLNQGFIQRGRNGNQIIFIGPTGICISLPERDAFLPNKVIDVICKKLNISMHELLEN